MKTVSPVPFTAVNIEDSFWEPRITVNRKVTLPIEHKQLKDTHRLDVWNWQENADWTPHQFWDSDTAKWIEAVAYSLSTNPDKALEKKVDAVVADYAQGQEDDGYLNSYYSQLKPDEKWSNLRDMHELYCAGHMMEAAVAYFHATGKRQLLDIMCRYADHIDQRFGPKKSQIHGYPGHQEIELALVKLYRATDEKRYLDLAKYFVDERGQGPKHFFIEEANQRGESNQKPTYYHQCHVPVRDQKEAVGHSVRACYLYAGMADVAHYTNDKELTRACRTLWNNITTKRMHITGGIGTRPQGERFTYDYDLPNENTYAETCAAIALAFFAHRMLQMELDGKYADVLEKTIYNGILSGVSMDGKRFFYANRLTVFPEEIHDQLGSVHSFPAERQEWFGCACCPPNIARFLASFGEYVYSTDQKDLWVHLYVGGEANIESKAGPVAIAQETCYPWNGDIKITVTPPAASRFAVNLRMPSWCRKWKLKINGKLQKDMKSRKGYVKLQRTWQPGDEIRLSLDMPIETVVSHPNVRQNVDRVALQRGPVVYCLEEVDNGKFLNQLYLDLGAKMTFAMEPKGVLEGTGMITGKAKRLTVSDQWKNELYLPRAKSKMKACNFKAVPYCFWGNRKPGEMMTFMRYVQS